EHSTRTLVRKVEFISAAGNPQALLTGKALFAWQKDKRRFRLESVHPGISRGEVLQSTGFDFDCPDQVAATREPGKQELELLRTKVRAEIAPNYPEFAARVWP